MRKLSADEIEKWITLDNGVHVPIKKGETEADVKKRLDGWSNQGSKKTDYHKYQDDKQKMTEEFKKNNPIMVNKDVVEALDYEVLADTYETIEDIKSKYQAYVTAITLTDDDTEDNVMATMDLDGVLRLNKEYFDAEWYLNDTYQECVNDRHHPPAPNGAIGVVSHELGHAIVHQRLYNMEKEAVKREHAKPANEKSDSRVAISSDIKKVDAYLNGKATTLMMDCDSGQKIFNKWYSDIQDVQERVRSNKDIQDQWSSPPEKPNLSILGLVRNFPRPYGISKYAEKNYHELIAEAFCDVYCNGNEASYMSKEVYNTFIKEMEK